MRFLFPLLLIALVAGCRFESRDAAPGAADELDLNNARLVEAEDVPEVTPSPMEAPDAETPSAEQPEVVLYVTEWCPYCAQARDFMADEGVPHRVVDIEASAEGAAEYQRMGGTGGIPLVAVGDETIEGWSAEMAREMLDDAGYN